MKPSPCFSVVRGLLQAAALPVDWYCLMCNSSKVWIWHITFSLNSRSSTDTGVLSDSYKDDINAERLHNTQQCFTRNHDFVKQKQQTINNFGDIVNILQTDAAIRSLLPEQTKCIRILLTIPLSSCTAERCFSALRFLKTFMLPWHRQA